MRLTLFHFIVCLALINVPIQVLADSEQNPKTAPTAPLQVLFIGNSYTYVNNLPAMLTKLASSSNSPRHIRAQMIAEPAATLQLLWEKGAAGKAIRERKWDFVVLQEQSVLPTVDPERMKNYASKFDSLIKKTGARTVLFITWTHREKPEMQHELNKAYLNLSRELEAQVAPVGPAWAIALSAAPGTQLHMEDGSHPTSVGSYLAACVFFNVMIDSQRLCPPPDRKEISREDAAVARSAAFQAVAKIH